MKKIYYLKLVKNKYMIKRNLNKILYFINSISLLILLISYLSGYIHPDNFWQISLLGLFFPAILAINFLFSIYWIIVWKKYFWPNSRKNVFLTRRKGLFQKTVFILSFSREFWGLSGSGDKNNPLESIYFGDFQIFW